MERKRFSSFMLVLVLLLTMVPVGVYAEDPLGTVRISSQGEFELALADGNVNHIIAESVELDIQQGTELTKDLTITSSAGLRISDNGLFIVNSDATLTVDSSIVVRQNGELRVGGILVNNGMVNVGGLLSAAAPAVIVNNGSLAISSDPAVGEGLISFIDILSDIEADSLIVTLTGSVPEVTGGAIKRTADVNGPTSLNYAMGNPQYNGIWFTEFHDERNEDTGETTGVAIVYPGDLTITKSLDIFENDEMLVTGNLTVQGPEGSLYIGGDLTVAGSFANSGDMFIDGSLAVSGAAINTGYYTQSSEAVVNGSITDAGDGDHMRGYYVTNQAEWETALADSAHCNPIVIGTEAVSAGAIVITTDTAVTSNLMVEGDLIINEGVTFSLQMRYDGDANGVMNDVSGTLTNNGTLETIVSLPVCGTFVNNGTLVTAANNGDDQGENWTENGCIILYVFGEEGQLGLTGHLENNGTILNDATISINDNATAFNSATGLIEGGTINSWWGTSSENTFPLINEGLIRFANIELDYTHLAYRDLDNTGSGWYENPEYGYGYELYCQKGSQYYGLFGLWDYDDVSEAWGFAAVSPGALVLSSGSGIALETLDPVELSTDPAQEVGNSAAFVRMTTSEWGEYEISYTAADTTQYRMAATVDIPPMGYYSGTTASRETYLGSATYMPGAGESFYAIVNGDFSEGWTSNFEILNGADQVTVATTAAVNVYQVTVNPETKGSLGLNLKIVLRKTGTDVVVDPSWWIELQEAETEGLVFSWTQWRDEESLGIQYPVIARDGGEIAYNTTLDTGPGGQMLSYFYRHWVGDESTGSWVYTPLAANQLTATSGSGIVFSTWQNDQAASITDEDYTQFEFTEADFPAFGSYVIGYHNGTENFTLPVSVGLPDVAFYSAPEATQENYIGAFSYGPTEAERQFYLITAPNPGIDPSWTNDVLVHDGSGYVTVTATGDRDIFLVTIDPGVNGSFRLHSEIRYFDGENQVWQADREINVSETPFEGLVFNWPDWRRTPDNSIHYPAVSKDGEGNININTSMHTAVGGVTAPFYFQYRSGEEWILEPVAPMDIVASAGSEINIQEWYTEGAESLEDSDYTDHKFTQIYFPSFGSYEFSYTTGSAVYTLPVYVELPGVGFYDSDTASEDSYLEEFYYSRDNRSFYMIARPDIPVGEGWTCEFEILDGMGWMDIATTGALGVFSVTVRDETESEIRLHARILYYDETHNERWREERDIQLHESEAPGLFAVWTGWKQAENIDYPALIGEPIIYDRSINASKGNYTFAFFFKHWTGDEASGYWDYTSVSPGALIVSAESGITKRLWTHENIGNIPADDVQYRNYVFTDISFPSFGDFTIGYQAGETLYEMPAYIVLPRLGAYTVPGGGEDNWLPEVPFDQYRTVYLVPTVDLSTLDLTRSTFYLPDGEGEDPYVYDGAAKTFSKEGYGSIMAHETEGVVDYFTMDIAALPFDPDFDLGLRLRDGDSQEIIGTTIRFVNDMPDAPSAFSGITLATPTAAGVAYDAFTSLLDAPAQSVRYVRFVSGALAGNGYQFSLTGDSTGTRLYLFDNSWMLLAQSASEDLSQADRTASIWTAGLTSGDEYYLAVYNESAAISDYELSAGLRAVPPAPTVTDPFYGSLFTMGVNASGATEGQHYILYAKIDGQWQWKGDAPYDVGNEPRFIHLFDFLQPGETAQSIGVAIGSDGVEGAITERVVTVIRQDSQSAEPAHIELMEQLAPDSDAAAVRLTGGGVFAEETYYRLHHENALGEWDYNASFFGDGTNIAQGGGYRDPEGDFDTGPWILTKYQDVGEGAVYTVGWVTLIDTTTGFGSVQRQEFDLFNTMLDTENDRVDLSVEIRSQKPEAARAARLMYALYDSDGRLIDLVLRPKDLTATGLSDAVSVTYSPSNRPAQCKIFVLNENCVPETEALMRILEFDD